MNHINGYSHLYMNDSIMTNISKSTATNTSIINTESVYQSDVPLYLKILASICYIVSMILGIGGNILVLLVIFYHQRMKTVTSFFIINLKKEIISRGDKSNFYIGIFKIFISDSRKLLT